MFETGKLKTVCPGFMVYWEDIYLLVDCLSCEQIGAVIKAIVAWNRGEEIKLTAAEKLAFEMLRRKIIAQEEKYLATVEKNRANARKRYE